MAKIPKPRFNLKAPNSPSDTLIFLVFRYRGKKLLYSTEMSVAPCDWDFDTQRPKQLERRFDLWTISQQLDALKNWCQEVYIQNDYGAIEVADFKTELDVRQGKLDGASEKKIRVGFLQFMDIELAEMKAKGMSYSSWEPYRRHARILQRFAEEEGRFDYEDVDWNFRFKLIDWLTEQGVSLNYGNKTLSTLKQFLERARRKKLHTNIQYHGNGWIVSQRKAKGQLIYLDRKELQKLADLPLTGRLKRSRDLFLIGAGTGQRFSDYSRYKPENFYTTAKGVPLLSIISQKTHVPTKVPLNLFPWLIPVLEEYEYTSPTTYNQKLNEDIKEIAQLAGLIDKVLVVNQFIGRKARITKSYAKKWEYVCTHTCRRSFATNLYRMGYSLAQIMPITGHAKETQLRDYIGLDAEENAEAIGLALLNRQNHI